MRHSSISSEASLTWSEGSSNSESELPQTPPDTPRHSAAFRFQDSPASWASSSEESDYPAEQDQEMEEVDATDAFQQLDLSSNPFTSPTKSVKISHISKWASELSLRSPPSPLTTSEPFKTSHKSKRPGLKMDLSSIPSFDYTTTHTHTPTTAQLINAPRIGCEPSPSPTAMTFGPVTPRPSLVSRFSDESASGSSSGGNTPPLQSPVGLLPSPAKLALPNLTGAQPMTPRTVDALDCFGISSSATSCLMSRGRSRDKIGQSNSRLLPRSPLSMPPNNAPFAPPADQPTRSPAARFHNQPFNPYFLSATSSA